jgi:hypothetical protein
MARNLKKLVIQPGARVTVIWLDASYTTDETALPDAISATNRQDQIVHTAGFWIKADEKNVAIGQDLYQEAIQKELRGVYRIPRGMILKILVHKEAEEIRAPGFLEEK